ncbi:abc transporter [Vairimorpha apis BRL 01]|uniref:Abc transporter n=1 Tax=Vairimorpha apis BRL 01 TaxID=1037528 RepID=T0MGC2_9MICR|nr:abc transporter [Vairimorpha apis BRL 01]
MEFKSEKTELLWKNLTLTLPDSTKKLLENVSGSVGPSSMTALMGPSGAGKTTLLNAIAGRLSNNLQLTGEIFLNGRPRNKKTWSRIMGYVEQDFYGYEYQTVYETLEFANKIKGSSNNEEYDNKNNNNFNGNSISNNKNSSNYNTKTTNIDNVSFGLTVSTMSPAQNIAQIIGSTVILLFTVYSGAFGSTAIIPSWLRWLIYVSPAYYGYTAILQNQFRDTTFYSSKTGNPVPGESLIYQNDTTIVAGCFIMEIVTRSEYKLEKQTDEDL